MRAALPLVACLVLAGCAGDAPGSVEAPPTREPDGGAEGERNQEPAPQGSGDTKKSKDVVMDRSGSFGVGSPRTGLACGALTGSRSEFDLPIGPPPGTPSTWIFQRLQLRMQTNITYGGPQVDEWRVESPRGVVMVEQSGAGSTIGPGGYTGSEHVFDGPLPTGVYKVQVGHCAGGPVEWWLHAEPRFREP